MKEIGFNRSTRGIIVELPERHIEALGAIGKMLAAGDEDPIEVAWAFIHSLAGSLEGRDTHGWTVGVEVTRTYEVIARGKL